MRNPFNFDRNDAEFAEAARTKRGRQNHIARLSIGRSWAFVGMIFLLAFWMLIVALEFFKFTANNLVWLLFSMSNLVSFVYLDAQIKFLKALEDASAHSGS